MEFGKLTDISGVDFTMPLADPQTQVILGGTPSSDKLRVYVGCTGWSMKEWVGKWYPPGSKPTEYLLHYGRQFNTIELNTTHYRTPDKNIAHQWAEAVPNDFRFCPKVLQILSHSRNLGVGTEQIARFCDALLPLDNKIGVCFMQLPPNFGRNGLVPLMQFLEQWLHLLPLAIEFRNDEIFSDEGLQQEFFAMLEHYKTGSVITDVAGRRDVLHQRLSTRTATVRFVGNGLHPTDFQRIDAWVEQLCAWHREGLEEAYFFTHEPDNLLAPELALYMVTQLSKHDSIVTRGPEAFKQEVKQMSLFD